MKDNIKLKIYRVSAILLAMFSVVAPLGVYADAGDDDSYSYTPSSNYSDSYSYTPSSNYSDSYSYTPSSNYSDNYSYTPSSNYSDSYSTEDYYTTDTLSNPNSYSYVDSYVSPTYSYSTPYYYNGGYSYGTGYNYNYGSNDHVASNPSVSGTCAGYPSSINVGQTVTWSANGSGGNGNYSYSWSGASSGSGQTVTNTYNTAGTQTATVRISSGGSSVTRTCSVYVQNNQINTNLDGYCTASPSNVYSGNTVTWNVNASGGNGNYTYSWSGDVSGSGSSVSQSYGGSGTRSATVAITSNGQTVYRNCSAYVNGNNSYDYYYGNYNYNYNNNNLSASCSSNITNPAVGQAVTLNAYANGGNGNYSYTWGGDSASGSGQSINQTFYTAGTKYITLWVYSNGQSTTANCQVNVGGNSNVTVYGNNAGTGGLTSGVFLSQVPYTGIKGGWNISIFILGLFFWSMVIAWFIFRKKEMREKFSRSEIVAKFKQQNLDRKLSGNN